MNLDPDRGDKGDGGDRDEGDNVVSFPNPLAIESEAENLSRDDGADGWRGDGGTKNQKAYFTDLFSSGGKKGSELELLRCLLSKN